MKKSIATGAKRGSVGTLILEALSSGDKYGWEIMKAIEEKSNGEYILKEPSLYSSLKRMEVSGLITSYWQDSDIGGRRHYYNLTEAGIQKLNKSSHEWDDEKQFVNELFTEEKTSVPSSSVDSSIHSLNKSLNEVQKTVHKLEQNEKNISRFILETEKEQLSKTASPIVEKPTKAGDKLILPTINPMQQDIFSAFSKVQNNVEVVKQEQTELVAPKIEQEDILPKEELIVITEEVKETAYELATKQIEEQKEINKKEKYASTPTTYVQMPMFEQKQTLSGIYIEETPVKKEEFAKPTIQHLKNLATEKDFLDMKNTFKNKHKSFLNRTQDYKKNAYKLENEESPSIYGSFQLTQNEVYEKTSYNNLGLEETLKAKEQLKEDANSKNVVVEQTPSFTKNTLTSFVEKEQKEVILEKDAMDDIDLKSILGELFTESEEDRQSHTSIKDLPRINVSDNINVTLRTKTKKEKVEAPVYTTPVYNSNANASSKAIYNENENIEQNNTQKLKNFHENLSTDEYSSSLLEDIYFESLIVRTHKVEQKAPLMTSSYISINKLNFNLSLMLFLLMLTQIIATYVLLTNAGYYANAIDHRNLLLFISFGVLAFVPLVINSLTYLFSPLRKKEINYNLLSKLGNNFIIMLIAFVFIYAVNLFAGMNTLNQADFIPTLVLPAVLTINLLLLPIIKFVLLKRKKYYL